MSTQHATQDGGTMVLNGKLTTKSGANVKVMLRYGLVQGGVKPYGNKWNGWW